MKNKKSNNAKTVTITTSNGKKIKMTQNEYDNLRFFISHNFRYGYAGNKRDVLLDSKGRGPLV